ncbi:MAG TPA: redoxin domain-containing protein [Symbiobacteriaceae bacterium]|nr:redoxin domain-containing protein [Symbiobacteriaceae bacterium]
MICPECGTQLTESGRYCHTCGWDQKLAAAGKASAAPSQRPAWKRRIMAWTLVFFAALMGFVIMVPDSSASASLKVGQAAPNFEVVDLDGKPVSLASLKGRPVVINFWATWCPPCRREMPEFEAVLAQHKDSDLAFYALNVGESKLAVESFLQQVGVKLPVLLDQNDMAQNAFKILPLPATFFIDRTGRITAISESQMTRVQIESEIAQILGQ